MDRTFATDAADAANDNPLPQQDVVEEAFREVLKELISAVRAYPPMRSAHEGHSIIEEEYEELWREVQCKPAWRSAERLRHEACQLAAMAIRFMIDVVPNAAPSGAAATPDTEFFDGQALHPPIAN